MPRVDDLLTPISEKYPSGADLRGDPSFLEIREARRDERGHISEGCVPEELEGEPEKPKEPDFPLVADLATEFLRTKSKDLQVAMWLAESLVRTEGAPGLLLGFELIRGLLEEYWDGLHPLPDEGDHYRRRGELAGLDRILNEASRGIPLTASGFGVSDYHSAKSGKNKGAGGHSTSGDFFVSFQETPRAFYESLVSDLAKASEILTALETTMKDRFPDDPPKFRTLRQSLTTIEDASGNLLSEKRRTEPDEMGGSQAVGEDENEHSESPGDRAMAQGAGSGVFESADPRNRIASAARTLRSQAPLDPGPYLLLRGFRWGELRVRGPDLDPHLLEAPPTSLRVKLKELSLNRDWKRLLEEGEELMATPYGRGWLDLQRFEMDALRNLGPEYCFVLAALRSALLSLLSDLPQLPNATLMDETPTASRETLEWLAEEGLWNSEGPQVLERGGSFAALQMSTEAAGLGRALALLRSGRVDRAVSLLTDEMNRERSERGKFLRRLQVAEVLVESGFEGIAIPILQDLAATIDSRTLEDWEAPPTVARALALLYRARRNSGEGSESSLDELLERISKLDPAQAFALRSEALSSGKTEGAMGMGPDGDEPQAGEDEGEA